MDTDSILEKEGAKAVVATKLDLTKEYKAYRDERLEKNVDGTAATSERRRMKR